MQTGSTPISRTKVYAVGSPRRTSRSAIPSGQRIDESIRLHDKLLLILSEHSVNSPWVQDEVEAALERERREKRHVLFPIRIDNAVMDTDQAWAASIRRTRHIGDFTKWKDHDSYRKAFDRLLRDLKSGEAKDSEANSVGTAE